MPPRIEEGCFVSEIDPPQLDAALARGWRHFGERFYRYSQTVMEGRLVHIIPLRIELSEFRLSNSQQRVFRKNAQTQCEILPASVDEQKEELFQRHSERFSENRPESIYDFLSTEPASRPCRCVNIEVSFPSNETESQSTDLIACSYLDLGDQAVSSIYAVFDPEHSSYNLGTYTLLKEIEYAKSIGKKHLYLGYATRENSKYDYKKSFSGLWAYDWAGKWAPYETETRS